ncbi:hypothetical protein [Paenibacillus aestuarii]|uniref:YCII-related domain-containing protein n=1 Tax=Paenibacillus aestuarii TaxID=516965 RepID=A0ABW0KJU4_9BACL|nr:hypothetical protein [Paenibacillus aestuarii]
MQEANGRTESWVEKAMEERSGLYACQAMIIPLAPRAVEEAVRLTLELQSVSVSARWMEEAELGEDAGSITDTEQGPRFVIWIGEAELHDECVKICDTYEQWEARVPMDLAIYRIERTFPPLNFT